MKPLLLLLALFSPPLIAGAWVAPVSYIDHQITHRLMAWEENDSDSNPCYQWSSCYLGTDAMYRSHTPTLYNSCQLNHNCIRIEHLRTRKQVMEAWRQQKGIPFTGIFAVESRLATCVGMFYIDRPRTPSSGNQSAMPFPGSVCSELPPENQSCHVMLPPEIDFGVLNASQVNDASAEVSGQVWCSLAGTVMLSGQSLLGERHIYFDGAARNFSGTLSINGQNAVDGVSIRLPGDNLRQHFRLTATLQAKSQPAAGRYSGNGIIYITWP